MTKQELLSQYQTYLEYIAEIPYKRSLKYAQYRGMIHGISIALDYDYETVEQDITLAEQAEHELMPGQLQLVI